MTEEKNYYVVIVDNYEESNRVDDYAGPITKEKATKLADAVNYLKSDDHKDYYMAVTSDHRDELLIKSFGGY